MDIRTVCLGILTTLSMDAPVSGPSPADAVRVAQIDAVVASTTAEWSLAFASQGRAYAAPRVIYLRFPTGHPARGAGYAPGAGVTVDLGEIDAIAAEFGSDSRTLIALIVAHEVGHHVQYLTAGAASRVAEPKREQEADCYAGWWLSRANAGGLATREQYVVPRLDQRIPELFHLLAKRGGAQHIDLKSLTHGTHADRAAAFYRGLATANPGECRV